MNEQLRKKGITKDMLKIKQVLFLAVSIPAVAFFLLAYDAWPASKIVYILFSLASWALLIHALLCRVTAGYVFLASAIWLGFWLKLSLHVVAPALPWMEPTGGFDFSLPSWDEVATVSLVGMAGVLTAGMWFGRGQSVKMPICVNRALFSSLLWPASLGLLGVVLFANEIFHIVHAVVPQPLLEWPFHLQGLLNWYLGAGAVMLLSLPMSVDLVAGRYCRAVCLTLFACLALGVSLFSRGTVVFQVLALLATVYVYRENLPQISLRQTLICGATISLCVVLSVSIAQVRRQLFFDYVKTGETAKPIAEASPLSIRQVFAVYGKDKSAAAAESPHVLGMSEHSLFLLMKLPVERWIGLEGVMAMTAFPDKSLSLLRSAVLERRVPGVVDKYTKDVAKSGTVDTKTVIYATPPSFIAFAYYSGNLMVVYFMTFLFALIVIKSETIITRVSSNPIFAASFGVATALQIIHMGTGGLIRPGMIYLTGFAFAIFLSFLISRVMRTN